MESSAVNKENKSLYAPSQIHAERILRHDGRPIIYQCLEIANRASKMTKYNSQKESYCYGITSCSQCQSGPCNAGSVCWYISAFWVVTHESHKTIIISNIQTVHGEKWWRTLCGAGDWTRHVKIQKYVQGSNPVDVKEVIEEKTVSGKGKKIIPVPMLRRLPSIHRYILLNHYIFSHDHPTNLLLNSLLHYAWP
jgi:hypothetical protein